MVHHVHEVGELAPAVHDGGDEHGPLGELEDPGKGFTLTKVRMER